MNETLLTVAGAIVLVTAATHSIVGERRLIGPLLRQRDGILAAPLARQVIRFAWHLTALLMAMVAIVFFAGGAGAVPHRMVALIGAGLLGAGLVDAVYSRGRHIGCPLLVTAGICALAALR